MAVLHWYKIGYPSSSTAQAFGGSCTGLLFLVMNPIGLVVMCFDTYDIRGWNSEMVIVIPEPYLKIVTTHSIFVHIYLYGLFSSWWTAYPSIPWLVRSCTFVFLTSHHTASKDLLLLKYLMEVMEVINFSKWLFSEPLLTMAASLAGYDRPIWVFLPQPVLCISPSRNDEANWWVKNLSREETLPWENERVLKLTGKRIPFWHFLFRTSCSCVYNWPSLSKLHIADTVLWVLHIVKQHCVSSGWAVFVYSELEK